MKLRQVLAAAASFLVLTQATQLRTNKLTAVADAAVHHEVHQAAVDQEKIAQVLVLAINTPVSQDRLHSLMASLGQHVQSLVHVVPGVDASKFGNEASEMRQPPMELNSAERTQWLQADVGFGPVHKGHTPEESKSNGMLACTMGHHYMWELAAKQPEGKWTVILEDDAKPQYGLTLKSLEQVFVAAPADVDEVFLDDRHCAKRIPGKVGRDIDPFSFGSTAYAVTAKGARALLAVKYRWAADHWLNRPVHSGAIAAYCPAGLPSFMHSYYHQTEIEGHPNKLIQMRKHVSP